jgi:hypothetical protein
MKTQISRNSFEKTKRYTGVYQQQGRMLTDADWNEMGDLLREKLAEALEDLVGNGSPRLGGLTVTSDKRIQPGDIYLDGLRALFPGKAPVTASAQPDLPGYPSLPATGPYVVYADMWERTVTALEDPGLRDPGLHGADTCTRTQLMLQVKTCPQNTNPESDIPKKGNASLSLELHSSMEANDPCDPCAGLLSAGEGQVGNYLFRLEVHSVQGSAGNPTRLVLKWSSENGAEQYTAQNPDKMPPGFISTRYVYEFFNLISEKHTGLHLSSGFTPTSGILKTDYEIPEGTSEPRDFVRRWDGYCDLTRTGPTWSLSAGLDKGVVLSTSASAAAPGHVSLGPNLSINLEALLLNLELTGKTFITGDFWLAPIRETIHIQGSEVITGKEPSGITHHYLKLARVASDGTLKSYDDDADRRRHSFPPLTDLDAHDIGYQADCGNGFFQNFIGTVKEALNKVCTIQAKDIGFGKPCNTGIYYGNTVSTVEDALKLLCDIRADQVSYQPGTGCTYFDAATKTVQDAIDSLCKHPAGGGCKITVGSGGQFETIEEALKTLIDQKIPDICLCLLPGTHAFGGTWQKEKEYDRFNLSITGCGSGAKVVLKDSLMFTGLTSLTLEKFAMETMEKEFPVAVDGCTDLVINSIFHAGLARKTPLLSVINCDHVRLGHNRMEAYTTLGFENPQQVFGFNQKLADLYKIARRNDFLEPARQIANQLAKLSQNDQRKIAEQILAALQEMGENLTINERYAYQQIALAFSIPNISFNDLFDGLDEVRDQAHQGSAGTGVVFRHISHSIVLENNTVFGNISLYGSPGKENLNIDETAKLSEMLKAAGLFGFMSGNTSFQAWDNRISNFSVGAGMVDTLKKIVTDGKGTVQGLFRTAQLDSNIIEGSRNQFLFENLTLGTNDFQTLVNPVGWVLGETAIYTGNRVRRIVDSRNRPTLGGGQMHTAVRYMAKAGNLPNNSW